MLFLDEYILSVSKINRVCRVVNYTLVIWSTHYAIQNRIKMEGLFIFLLLFLNY